MYYQGVKGYLAVPQKSGALAAIILIHEWWGLNDYMRTWADDFSKMKTTILGHFGEADRSIKVDDVKAFQATLQTASGKHEVYIYPNAGHAFDDPGAATYDKEVSDLAWQRTIEFLKKYL